MNTHEILNNTNNFFIYSTNLISNFITIKYLVTLNLDNLSNLLNVLIINASEEVLISSLNSDLNNLVNINNSILWSKNWTLFNINNVSNYSSNIILDINFLNLLIISDFKINTSNYFITNTNTYILENLNLTIIKIITLLSIFYILSLLFILISPSFLPNDRDEIDTNGIINDTLMQSDKEIGAFDDLMNTLLISIFMFCGFVSQFILIKSIVLPNINMSILSILLFILVLFLNLLFLAWDIGSQFLVFLRGASRKNSFVYEAIMDYIFIISFFVRTLIQNVRIFLIIVYYYSYMHTMEAYSSDIFIFNLNLSILNDNFSVSESNIIITFIKMFIHLTFEIFHSIIALIMQIISFFTIIFWIFNSLYFSHENNNSEQYFLLKKSL